MTEVTEVRCKIQKYDAKVTEPPLKFIDLGSFVCDGNQKTLHLAMRAACINRGYSFRFYSTCSDEGFDFSVTVRGEMEDMGHLASKNLSILLI